MLCQRCIETKLMYSLFCDNNLFIDKKFRSVIGYNRFVNTELKIEEDC